MAGLTDFCQNRATMRRTILFIFVFVAPVFLGQTFEQQRGPKEVAFGFLQSSGGIATDDLSSVYIA